MWIKIKPMDVIIFRTSKPFGAGESFRAEGIFPPTAIPFIGALRSRAITHLMDICPDDQPDYWQYDHNFQNKLSCQIINQLGTPDDLGPLSFNGPYLSLNESICLPLPRDLMQPTTSETGFLSFLTPGTSCWPVTVSKPNLDKILMANDSKTEACESGFLSGNHLGNYLTGDSTEYFVISDIVSKIEPRIGIKMSSDGTAEHGLIYNVLFHRLVETASFWFKITSTLGNESSLLPDKGFLALGGESRAAYFEKVSDEKLPAPLSEEQDNNIKQQMVKSLVDKRTFKLYLISPAIFEQGWLPDCIDPHTYEWEPLTGFHTKLIAAAVGKYASISGWDLMKNLPKPLLRAVPAGSVYFFQAREPFTEATAIQFIENIHQKSIIQNKSNTPHFQLAYFRSAGFGTTAVGVWHERNRLYV